MPEVEPARTAAPGVPSFSLRGKVVVLVGGSGLLGRGLVTALAGSGATVIITSRDRARVEAIAAEERKAGRSVHPETCGLEDESEVLGLRDRVCQAYARIDGMVFNAAYKQPMKQGWGSPLAEWETSMQVNATGFFAVLRAFGDAMAGQGGGSIVAIASMQGLVGQNPWLYEGTNMFTAPDYFFQKAGMLNLTRFAATYYGGKKVRVNAVAPGGIYNPEKPQAPDFLQRFAKMTALGRMADAGEITGAVVFLLSEAATYLTGATITVDGGYTIR
jgi:NAD(P)-dependent dehydrogenase (short-subunit alcohol dehydrogenase family)